MKKFITENLINIFMQLVHVANTENVTINRRLNSLVLFGNNLERLCVRDFDKPTSIHCFH